MDAMGLKESRGFVVQKQKADFWSNLKKNTPKLNLIDYHSLEPVFSETAWCQTPKYGQHQFLALVIFGVIKEAQGP